MAGYSGTPLGRKLGFADGQTAAFVNLPERLATLPELARFGALAIVPGVRQLGPGAPWDVIHIFTTERHELERGLPDALAALARAGMIWVSWPKKSSGVPSTVTEDVIREVTLPLGLVDVKVCAIDEIWSGLKLVIRKDRR
jgi:hypothetical protein